MLKMENREGLTIGVPVYNEAKSLPHFLKTLISAINKLSDLELEIIFCVNGCSDNSLDIIRNSILKEQNFR